MDTSQATRMGTVQQTLEEVAQDSSTLRCESMQQLMKIDSLEKSSIVSLRYGHESMVSLASIVSSITEIERRLSLVRISSRQSLDAQGQRSPEAPTNHVHKSSNHKLGLDGEYVSQLVEKRRTPRTERLPRVVRLRRGAMFSFGGSSTSGDSVESTRNAKSIASYDLEPTWQNEASPKNLPRRQTDSALPVRLFSVHVEHFALQNLGSIEDSYHRWKGMYNKSKVYPELTKL